MRRERGGGGIGEIVGRKYVEGRKGKGKGVGLKVREWVGEGLGVLGWGIRSGRKGVWEEVGKGVT